jgi:hypothetical protein
MFHLIAEQTLPQVIQKILVVTEKKHCRAEPTWYITWCFANAEDAGAFAAEFGGTRLTNAKWLTIGRGMCNLYSITKGQRAIIEFTRAMRDTTGNLPPLPGVFPDYLPPIVRNAPDGVRELVMARWGMPSSQFALMQSAKKRAAKIEAKGGTVDFKELLRMEPDTGTTNIRNVNSKHWQRWLGIESSCVVPFTSFSEFNKAGGGDI